MPNPLIPMSGVFGRRQTPDMADPPKDRDNPDIINDYGAQEVVFPYRGTEPHGVDPTEHSDDTSGYLAYEDTTAVDVTPAPPEPEPVPVRIVSQGSREIVAWRATRVFADAQARLLVNRNERRRALRIKNMGNTNYPIVMDTNTPLGVGQTFDTGTFVVPSGVTSLQVFGTGDQNFSVALRQTLPDGSNRGVQATAGATSSVNQVFPVVPGATYFIRYTNTAGVGMVGFGVGHAFIGTGGHTVYLSPDNNVSAFDGYPLAAGAELQLQAAESEVYGISDDGTQVELAVLSEQAIEL